MKLETLNKYGKLVQFGINFMENFNEDEIVFATKYNEYYPEISENGYSHSWYSWLEQNQNLVNRLYDALNEAKKIPTLPNSSV
jgi:hypothetical protein